MRKTLPEGSFGFGSTDADAPGTISLTILITSDAVISAGT